MLWALILTDDNNASENGLEPGDCDQTREGSHRLAYRTLLGGLIHWQSQTCLDETFSDSVDNGLGSTVLDYLASIVA